MEAIKQLTSTAIPFLIDDVDTDQIIPARFLKATTRLGFGDNLFRDWRYLDDDVPNPEFFLNQKSWEGSILICGRNFGCGSSREHAAWAIYDYGFRVLISESFADIFKNNALNNGLLPIELPPVEVHKLAQAVTNNHNLSFTVDLVHQTITVPDIGFQTDFDIPSYKKYCLINGYDNIDYLLSIRDEITKWESLQPEFLQ